MTLNQKQNIKKRILFWIMFLLLVGVEVLIALFVHDKFVRPYIGDVIVVAVLYCFVRGFIPTGVKLLPLYLFMFSTAIEIAQYFNYVTLLGLNHSKFFRVLLGTSFSFTDILCYTAGSAICFAADYIIRKKTI